MIIRKAGIEIEIPGSTDLRKGVTGLLAIIENEMHLDALSNSVFFFCNKSHKLLKIIFWNKTGYCKISNYSLDLPSGLTERPLKVFCFQGPLVFERDSGLYFITRICVSFCVVLSLVTSFVATLIFPVEISNPWLIQ